MNTPKQCARAQDKVDLNSGSRALTGHRFRVTHRSEFLVSFVSQDKRNSLAHAMCQWKPAQTSASETFHRNLCGRRYAGDFIVSASADVAGMSLFQPACCLGVGADIAATSDVSRFFWALVVFRSRKRGTSTWLWCSASETSHRNGSRPRRRQPNILVAAMATPTVSLTIKRQ